MTAIHPGPKKVLLFGATGNLGKEIAKQLRQRGNDLTIVVRNKEKAAELSAFTTKYIIADITQPSALIDICKGFDIVISALGKSVSLNDNSKPSFRTVDLEANSNILADTVKHKVSKFVYVSAFHSEQYPHLEYFKVHHEFSEKLKHSGLNYSIIKPVAIFSAFIDLMQMAKKGQLVTMGSGDKKTNPIFEGDLATICVDAIDTTNTIIDAGGKNIYIRKQVNDIIQQAMRPEKKVRQLPMFLFTCMLPLIKLYNRNMYDKFAFFLAVMQTDLLAPQLGSTTLEEYVQAKKLELFA